MRTVSPTINTTYTVTVSNSGNTCSASATISVTVNANPNISAGTNKTICNGTSTTLNATGGGTYAWNGGSTNASLTVSPTVNTTYTVTGTSTNGCTGTDDVIVTVQSKPTATISGITSICKNNSVTLTASGGLTYSWNTGEVGLTINKTPPSTTTYTVTATNANGCAGTDDVIVIVRVLPTATISGPTAICKNESVTLTASASGSTYLWNTGDATSAINKVPLATTTYTVTATNFYGCTDTEIVGVTVSTCDTLNADFTANTICLGSSTAFTDQSTPAASVTGWLWDFGDGSTSGIQNPVHQYTTAGKFNVTLTISGNTGNDNITKQITVNAKPNVSAGTDTIICNGDPAMLTATGGFTYSWNTGALTSGVFLIPNITSTYTVTASDIKGCSASDEVIVNLNALPTASINGLRAICNGDSTTLTAMGGITFEWNSPMWSTTDFKKEIVINPVTNTIYTVTVVDGNGCTDKETIVVTVYPAPIASISGATTLCKGTSISLTANDGSIYESSYSWNTTDTNNTTWISPLTTTTYMVTVTLINGCTDSAKTVVTVNSCDSLTADFSASTVCLGNSTVFSDMSSPADSIILWAWDFGDGSTSGIQNPVHQYTTAGKFNVTLTISGSTGNDNITKQITVNAKPNVSAGTDTIICNGDPAMLTATGGFTYSWNTGALTSGVFLIPNITSTYTVTATDIKGCSASDEITVWVNTIDLTINDIEINKGEQVTLDAGNWQSYFWSNSEITQTITVSPAITTTYTLTVIDINGCTDSDIIVVTVLTLSQDGCFTDDFNDSNYTDNVAWVEENNDDKPGVITMWNNDFVRLYRVAAGSNGGELYLKYSPDLALNSNTNIKFDICPINRNVRYGDGDNNEEHPASISLYLRDSVNNLLTLRFCYNYNVPQDDSTAANYIRRVFIGTQSVWQRDQQFTIADYFPQAVKLETIRIGGSGWNFEGQYDNIQIICTDLYKINITGDTTICAGDSITLKASSDNNIYFWENAANPGVVISTDSIITIFPNDTTIYLAYNNSDTAYLTIYVKDIPVIDLQDLNYICETDIFIFSLPVGNLYNWSTGETSNTITVAPIVKTIYTVTVTSKGCSNRKESIVEILKTPLIVTGDTICSGDTTVVKAFGSGVFSWNTGDKTPKITVFPSETTIYSVTISLSGCTATGESMILVNANPVANVSPDISICIGDSVVLSANGGGSYQWSSGCMDKSCIVSNAGIYKITVTSDKNCSSVDSVSVTLNFLPVANGGNDTTICEGASLTLNANGGISYLWSTNSSNKTCLITEAGIYSVTVTDINGCTNYDTITVNVYKTPTITFKKIDNVCINVTSHLINNASPAGGTYWGTAIMGNSINPSLADTGIHTVYYTYLENGCADTASQTVYVMAVPKINIRDQIICYGDSVILSAGTENGKYIWNDYDTSNIKIVSPITNTTYTVSYTNTGSCSTLDDVIVTVSKLPEVDIQSDYLNGCVPYNVVFKDVTFPVGKTYIWNFGDNNIDTTSNRLLMHTYNETGIYDITVTAITSDNCSSTKIFQNFISVLESPYAEFSYFPLEPTNILPDVDFRDISNGNIADRSWYFGDTLSDNNTSSLRNPIHTYLQPGDYTVKLIVTSFNSCTDTQTVNIHVSTEFRFYSPNAFTPNNDGINEFFSPIATGIDEHSFNLYIYSRWGELLFHAATYNEPWDGRKQGKTEIVQQGVYTWLCTFNDIEGNFYRYIGAVVVIP